MAKRNVNALEASREHPLGAPRHSKTQSKCTGSTQRALRGSKAGGVEYLCVYVSVYLSICVCAYLCICVSVYLYICVSVYLYNLCIDASVFLCVGVGVPSHGGVA